MVNKKQIAQFLDEIADMMEYNGENKFKIIAFRKAATSIKKANEDISTLISEDRLWEVKGVGKGIGAVIKEFVEEGESPIYVELTGSVPKGFLEFTKLRSITPQKAKNLIVNLRVNSIEELEEACLTHRVAHIGAFGEKGETELLWQIKNYVLSLSSVLIDDAESVYNEIDKVLGSQQGIDKYSVTGEYRRGREIISSVSFVVLTKVAKKLVKQLQTYYPDMEVTDEQIEIKNAFQIPVIIYLCSTIKEYYSKLFYTTGSNSFMETFVKGEEVTGKNEEEIFKKLSLNYIIPEMRETEYHKFESLKANSDLEMKAFKGLLHFHTTYSDGMNSLTEMIDAAGQAGYSYVAVCDHSKAATYANGMKEEKVIAQHEEIELLSKEKSIKIFRGIEVDIMKSGDLDYDSDFIQCFDFVVASIHNRFGMYEMTERMIKAIENPCTDLLGHPSGRLLLSRDAYQFDTKKIIDACAANDVAIEINANPRRLDIDWRWLYYAKDKGVKFAINPDAHSTNEISFVNYGIMAARKGGVQQEDVINCLTAAKFKKFLNRKVGRKIK